MKQGGRTYPTPAEGFTIIETMIVLAVTAILAVSALLLVNGRQNKTEFQTGINDLQQQLQQIINQTESGYYPTTSSSGGVNFTCQTGSPPVIKQGSSSQGTNGDCIFLGKVIYFGPGSNNGSNDSNSYTVLPIAGNRLYAGMPVTSLQQAWPVAISLGGSTNPANVNAPDNNYTVYHLENGLSYVWGRTSGTPNNPFALGVFNSVGTQTSTGIGSASSGASGATQFSLYGFGNGWGSPVPAAIPDVVDKIESATTPSSSAVVQIANPIQFCIASGTTNQSGLFTITPGLTVSLQIKGGTVC